MIRNSHQWFGDSLVQHFRLLDWGFRFGGDVITVCAATQITFAVALTAITAVSNQVLGSFYLSAP